MTIETTVPEPIPPEAEEESHRSPAPGKKHGSAPRLAAHGFPPDEPTPSFPYLVEAQVGVGSMGVVYRALEIDLDRTVAIKTLRASLLEEESAGSREETRRRFLQEAQAAGRLTHPGVTTVYRVGEEAGLPYIVMEWLEGQTLEERLRARTTLPIPEAARLAVLLLDTLEAAHRGGVVHRDVKPSNLVLLDDERLKVTDFGIALVRGKELVETQAGVVLATPKYASPEQLRGGEVDGRSDLFATGILLYRMVSGRFPFAGEDFLELANSILQSEPPHLREIVPDVPPAFEAVVRKALRKGRGDRFASAADMADALRPLADGDVEAMDATVPALGVTAAPVIENLASPPALAVAELVAGWPGGMLEEQSTDELLERLLDRPLHADPFAGALRLGNVILLIADGVLLDAVDTRDGRHGDAVAEALPRRSRARLHPLPESYPRGLLPVLATVLAKARILHGDLDSSFVNLPALARKLKDDGFHGVFRLERGDRFGLVLFVDGEAVVSLYSRGWGDVPVDQSWSRWIGEATVKARVEERTVNPPNAWFRRAYHDVELEVVAEDDERERKDGGDPSGNTSKRLRQLFQSTRARAVRPGDLMVRPATEVDSPGLSGTELGDAPVCRCIDWALHRLPRHMAERDRVDAWRYLTQWLMKVRRIRLFHRLPRPDFSDGDRYDAVTYDEEGKILHLLHRIARPTPEEFEAFVERAVATKLAHKKTGDIGGVILAAETISEEVLEAYRDKVSEAASGSWLSVEETFTGYEGFLRVGATRGFHLLLVEETEEGFRPILPD